MIIMDKKVVVYIPTAFTVTIKQTAAVLAKRFGGSTNMKGDKIWLDEDSKAVTEPITTITAWYSSNEKGIFGKNPSQRHFMTDLAAKLRDNLKEDCIAIEVEGEMLLV